METMKFSLDGFTGVGKIILTKLRKIYFSAGINLFSNKPSQRSFKFMILIDSTGLHPQHHSQALTIHLVIYINGKFGLIRLILSYIMFI
jgi:hypothetical protein